MRNGLSVFHSRFPLHCHRFFSDRGTCIIYIGYSHRVNSLPIWKHSIIILYTCLLVFVFINTIRRAHQIAVCHCQPIPEEPCLVLCSWNTFRSLWISSSAGRALVVQYFEVKKLTVFSITNISAILVNCTLELWSSDTITRQIVFLPYKIFISDSSRTYVMKNCWRWKIIVRLFDITIKVSSNFIKLA
jgi:hypothetical protein